VGSGRRSVLRAGGIQVLEGRLRRAGPVRPIQTGCQDHQGREELLPDLPGRDPEVLGQRTEEFVVRAYKGGKKKAAHKSTSPIFQRYLYVKENLLSIRQPEICHDLVPDQEKLSSTESQLIYWDSKVSEADMNAMWKHPDVYKEWIKSGERRGNVRFSHDAKNRPYLSR
uniref:Uncharacterized protein n=1 Tax=Zea mays TaxID=4577 RepID=A0A804QMJ4_MAIZE